MTFEEIAYTAAGIFIGNLIGTALVVLVIVAWERTRRS